MNTRFDNAVPRGFTKSRTSNEVPVRPFIEDGEAPDTVELSIVVPVFNESGNLQKLTEELLPVIETLGLATEVVFIDDGSKDDTWVLIQSLNERYPNIRGLRLSRNFGHQYALFAGLCAARGRAVISMDGDLQHPPSVIPDMVKLWRQGFQIVNTKRRDPTDFSPMKRLLNRIFYRVFSFLSGVDLEYGMADFRLLDRRVVNEIARMREEGLFLRGLVQWVGYQRTIIEFQCEERFSGKTKYPFTRMHKFAWHGISTFSLVPLRIGILIGVATSFISFGWLVQAVYEKMVAGTTVPGWASTVGILSFLFGILFIILGVIGEYIGRILVQVRVRPLYIIAESAGVRNTSPFIEQAPYP